MTVTKEEAIAIQALEEIKLLASKVLLTRPSDYGDAVTRLMMAILDTTRAAESLIEQEKGL